MDKLEEDLKSELSSNKLKKESLTDVLDILLCAEFHQAEKAQVRIKRLISLMNVILKRTKDAKLFELCRNIKRAGEQNRNKSFLKCIKILDAGYRVEYMGEDKSQFKFLANWSCE